MKKGFVISLDALIALLIFAVLIGTSAFYLEQAQAEARNSTLLKEAASDVLTVLDKTLVLETAIEDGSTTGIMSFLGKLPYNMCGEVLIYKNSDLSSIEVSVLRQGCSKTFDEVATVKRDFFVESNGSLEFYIAELKAWVRETK